MKKLGIIKYFVFIIFLILISTTSRSQIPPPNLKNVTIINDEGDVKLLWEYPDSIDNKIVISRDLFQFGDWVLKDIARVQNVYTWIDESSHANKRTHAYRLSFDPPKQNPKSNLFNTIYSTVKMDTCQKSNIIEWTRYVEPRSLAEENWNDTISIRHYNIWRITNEKDTTLIDSIHSQNNAFIDSTIEGSHHIYRYTDPNIEYDNLYKYYVEGVRAADTSIKSKSNRVVIDTDMPDPPGYIHFQQLSHKEGKVNLKFEISEDTQLEKYVLIRNNPDGTHDTINTFRTNTLSIDTTDESVNINKGIYQYHLAAVNQCGALTTRSDTLSTLQFKVEKQNLNNVLEWNTMNNIPGSTIRYNIYRKIGEEGNFKPLATSHQGSYTDNQVQNFRGQGKSAQFCYFVEAEIDHQSGRQSVVSSENQCVYIKPRIFIPNAIIPNDPNNRNFKPEFTFIPRNYLMIIYNRNGIKVFESNDPQKPWKGRIRRGEMAPGGTYIYYLEVKNPGQQIIRRKGEVTVIYQR